MEDDDGTDSARFAEMRSKLERMMGQVPVPGWPVFGVRGRSDELLGAWSVQDDKITDVELVYGDRWRPPRLTVSTQPVTEPLSSLDQVLALDFANDDEGGYPLPRRPRGFRFGVVPEEPRAAERDITIAGTTVAGAWLKVGSYEALRVAVGTQVVTVIGRGCEATPDLEVVADLSAAHAARVRWIERMRTNSLPGRPPPVELAGPDTTEPLWAHRTLTSYLLPVLERLLRVDGGPVIELPADWAQVWQAATRRQAALHDQNDSEAEGSLRRLRDQLADLAGQPWWAEPIIRQRAVEEIIWFVATGEDQVASAEAQRIWRATPRSAKEVKIGRLKGTPPPVTEPGATTWQTAWQEWADQKRPH